MLDLLKDIGLETVKWTLDKAIGISYWPCLLICMFGIIFYMVGIKKAGKYATGSLLTYVILQALKVAL